MKNNSINPNIKSFDDLCIVITYYLNDKCKDALNKGLITIHSSETTVSDDFTDIEIEKDDNFAEIVFNVWIKPYEIPYLKAETMATCICTFNINKKDFDISVSIFSINDEFIDYIYYEYLNNPKKFDMSRFIDFDKL